MHSRRLQTFLHAYLESLLAFLVVPDLALPYFDCAPYEIIMGTDQLLGGVHSTQYKLHHCLPFNNDINVEVLSHI